MKKPERLRSTNHSLPAMTVTDKDDDDSNVFTKSNYKKVSNFLKDSKEAKQQQNKIIECKCWVCKILNSKITADDKTSTAQQYEPYNIVSATGDSINSPQYEEFTTLDDIGQVFISEAVIEVVNQIIDRHKRLGSSLKNSYEDEY